MTPYFDDGQVTLYLGDCREVLADIAGVHAVITDPPYHLTTASRGGSPRQNDPASPYGRHHIGERGFMGKAWDGGDVAIDPLTWLAVRLAMKPGAHLLSFGGTRTYHRMACAIEDAGFEIRDSLMWLYGSGFPKSLDVSKAIDKMAGAEREVVGEERDRWTQKGGVFNFSTDRPQETVKVLGEAATDAAREWNGWGTALKPAYEPIVLARKPLAEPNVAANVLAHGTGALNVDGCRIETDERCKPVDKASRAGRADWRMPGAGSGGGANHELGRWPANVCLDEHAADLLDAESGVLTSGARSGHRTQPKTKNTFGSFTLQDETPSEADTGGASRFFYCAKASQSERGKGNDHPTVKPLALMRWLVRLVTPVGGIVLDPFMGSGTTILAAQIEGKRAIGIDLDERYLEITAKRLSQQVLFTEAS